MIQEPTHLSSQGTATLIDLAILSDCSQLLSWEVVPLLGNSDHSGISVCLKWSSKCSPPKQKCRSVWRYSLADFDLANSMILEADWDWINSAPNVDVAWRRWEDSLWIL